MSYSYWLKAAILSIFNFFLQLKLPQIYSIVLESWKPKLTCINL